MATAPYDSLELVVNTSRMRLNDMIQSVNGDILTDDAVFTPTVVNSAWRRLLDALGNYGYSAFGRDVVLPSAPIVATTDTGTFAWFDWDNYFDGAANQGAPVLPQDMIAPLDLYARVSNSGQAFRKMNQSLNGLPNVSKGVLNRHWEWRDETVYIIGATALNDFRMRYAASLPDFVANSSTAFSAQFVPLVRALNPLSWFICREVSAGRNDVDAADCETKAQEATVQMFNRDPRQGRSLYKRSELGKMTDQYTPTAGPTGPRGKAA